MAQDIAKKTGYTGFDNKMNAFQAWQVARHRLSLLDVKTLVIDECHYLLRSGSGRDVPGAIQTPKHMMQGDHAVALIVIGVPELREAILIEETGESIRRFDEYIMPKVSLASQDAVVFDRCLSSCCHKLGIEIDPTFSERILFSEHGEIGRSTRLAKGTLRQAVIKNRNSL